MMIHRTILTSFGLFALITCQNQNVSQNTNTSENTEVTTNTTVSTPKSTPVKATKNGEPEMSVGLPPDKEAEKIAQEEQASASTNKQGIIYLSEGENKFLKEYEMNVTFKKMTEDSRCPKGVNCVWAGVATAEVELMGLATRPIIVKLSTMNNAGKGYYKTQDFNGYAVSLVEITPETTSDKGFNALKGSYKIGLKFTKGAPTDPTIQRGGTTTK